MKKSQSPWAGLVALLLTLAGCDEMGESLRCRSEEAAQAPPECEAYYEACIDQAVAAYIVDIDRVGPTLARRVLGQHQATCDSGWSTCVEQGQRLDTDGGHSFDGGTQ